MRFCTTKIPPFVIKVEITSILSASALLIKIPFKRKVWIYFQFLFLRVISLMYLPNNCISGHRLLTNHSNIQHSTKKHSDRCLSLLFNQATRLENLDYLEKNLRWLVIDKWNYTSTSRFNKFHIRRRDIRCVCSII